MKRVWIAGPHRAATAFEVDQNIRRAMIVRDAVLREGHFPITPHLLTAHCDGALDEGDLAKVHGWLLSLCDEVRIVLSDGRDWTKSEGTRAEVSRALRCHIPVFEFDIQTGSMFAVREMPWGGVGDTFASSESK